MGQVRGTLYNFYKWIFNQSRKFDTIPVPKKDKKLPVWLTVSETNDLIQSVKNIKHKAMVQLAYSCALRVSEVISVQISDISDGYLTVRSGKGRKDRQIPIPEETLVLLRTYYRMYKPKIYLFHGMDGHYTSSSIQAIIKRAACAARIRKKVTCHTLRHSRATHWYNNGLPLLAIRDLLGHSRTETTEIYTHIAQDDYKEMVARADSFIKRKVGSGTGAKIHHAEQLMINQQ
jgi:integrase